MYAGDEHVLRLEVTMHDARRMRCREAAAGTDDDLHDIAPRLTRAVLAERDAVDPLAREHRRFTIRHDLVDGDDVRVL
jgi:hypothetical protein